MPKDANRVTETSTSTGTGNFTLSGALLGHRTFATAFGTGANTEVHYGIAHDTLDQWEVGIGNFLGSSNTFQRDVVFSGSSGGSKVNFSAGSKLVYVHVPAEGTRTIRAPRSTDVALELRGASGQTAALLRTYNGSGAPVLLIDADGNIRFDCNGGSGSTTWDITPTNNTGSGIHSIRIGRQSGTSTVVRLVMLEPGTANAKVTLDGRGFIDVGDYYIGANVDGTPNPATISAKASTGFNFRSGFHPEATTLHFLFRGNDSTVIARIDADGTATVDGNTIITREKGDARYQAISSERFKERIEPRNDLAAIFPLLTTKSFVWGGDTPKSDERFGTSGVGFIAEEVAAVLPEAGRYIRPDDKSARVVLQSLDPLALAAVLHAKIVELDSRLGVVETRPGPARGRR